MKQKRDILTPILILLALCCFTILGCRTYIDHVTPAPITQEVLDYTGTDPCDIPLCLSITTLKVLKDQETKARVKHREEQIDLQRLAQDDKRFYSDVINYTSPNIQAVEAIQDTILGAAGDAAGGLPGGGLISLALGAFGGGALGRRYKRPGDLSPAEVEEKIAEAKRAENS